MNEEILAKILGTQEIILKELMETKTIALNTQKEVAGIKVEQQVMKEDIADIKAEQQVMKEDIADIKAEQQVMKRDIEKIKICTDETCKYIKKIEEDVSYALKAIMENTDNRLRKLEHAIL